MTSWQASPGAFTAPFTATGHSALVPPPPWHYAGWLINVEFEFGGELGGELGGMGDGARAAGLVPPQAGRPTGLGCVHFADWQACTDGRELLDPVQAQYRETLVLLQIERPDGTRCLYCPAIWVDQDVALLRGLLQGWPKKFGSTWLTRSLPLDHPSAAPLRAGSRLGASVAVKDRRLIEASLSLTGEAGEPLGFLAAPTLGLVGWPDLRQPEEPTCVHLVRSVMRGHVCSAWHAAQAELRLLPHPGEELSALGTLHARRASVGWAGLTVTGAADV